MFKLEDGRENLWQWDLDRRVIVEDPDVCEVHFCNRTSECSLVVEPYVNENGVFVANIPNIILQEARPIRVYAYVDDKYTLVEEQFSVKSRSRPDDYAYTETHVIRWDDLYARADEAIETAEKTIEEVNNTANEFYHYVEGHELKLTDDEAGNVTLHGVNLEEEFATKAYVDEAIANVDTGNVDLSDYYTKEEVDKAISEIDVSIPDEYITETELNAKGYLTEHQSLEEYAKKTDIPSTDGLATKQELNDLAEITEEAINTVNANIPSLEGYAKTSDIPDVSAYQTAEQVNTLINTALSGIATAEGGSY